MANWFNKKCENFFQCCVEYRRDVNFFFGFFFILLLVAVLIKNNWSSMSDLSLIKKFILSLLQFFQHWGPQQWIWSIAAIVMSYSAFLNRIFNQVCLKYTGEPWLTLRQRLYVILLDLILNVKIGMIVFYYFPDSEFAIFMSKCPIALSPGIFAVEVIVLFVYCYLNRKK